MDLAAHSSLDLHAQEAKKYHTYVQIALTLAMITGSEIVIIYLPIVKWFLIGTLVGLSAIKFLLVIFFFMHLRWDKLFCTILFFIGLTTAGLIMWALLALFRVPDSRPIDLGALAPPAPVVWRTDA